MKIFLDSTNIEEIREINKLGIIDGITTNPSLIAKSGKGFNQILKSICKEVKGPVSAEVTAESFENMLSEAKILSKISKNIVIKLKMHVSCTCLVLKMQTRNKRSLRTLKLFQHVQFIESRIRP